MDCQAQFFKESKSVKPWLMCSLTIFAVLHPWKVNIAGAGSSLLVTISNLYS